jgi:hypothetical protein
MINLPVNRVLTFAVGAVSVIGGVLASAPVWARIWFAEDLAYLVLPLTGVALGLPAFVLLCTFCRCTDCGYRIFWHSVSARSHPRGLDWFLWSGTQCPRCGFAAHAIRRDAPSTENEPADMPIEKTAPRLRDGSE